MATGRLTFVRGTTWQDLMRSYKIIVDDAEVGKLRPRGAMSVDVDAGAHTCQARIDWSGSEAISVSVPAGGEVRISVSPAPGRTLGRALSTADWLVLTVDDGPAT